VGTKYRFGKFFSTFRKLDSHFIVQSSFMKTALRCFLKTKN